MQYQLSMQTAFFKGAARAERTPRQAKLFGRNFLLFVPKTYS